MTAGPATLRALISRLEGGEISRRIEWWLGKISGHESFSVQSAVWPPFAEGSKADLAIPAYLTLVDAAIAFAKAVLPGYSIELRISGFGGQQAILWDPMKQPAPGYDLRVDMAGSRTAPALVLATLKAKLAEVEAPNA